MLERARLGRMCTCLAAAAVAGVALVGAALPASAAPVTAATMARLVTVSPNSATECADGACLSVVGSGLHVDSATITNESAPPGFGKIINVDGGVTHTSPHKLNPGQSFTVAFDRDLQNGDQICGQVGSSTLLCVTIHS